MQVYCCKVVSEEAVFCFVLPGGEVLFELFFAGEEEGEERGAALLEFVEEEVQASGATRMRTSTARVCSPSG